MFVKKNFGNKKIFGPKNVGSKNYKSKKISEQNFFGLKQIQVKVQEYCCCCFDIFVVVVVNVVVVAVLEVTNHIILICGQ